MHALMLTAAVEQVQHHDQRGIARTFPVNLATREQWCDAKSRYPVLDIPGNRTCASDAMLFTFPAG